MKKSTILILFLVCISATANELFAQSESVQDKLMKYKWVEDNGEYGPSSPGYIKYTEISDMYYRDINDAKPSTVDPYYLSRNMISLSFNESRVGKNKNGRYLYREVGKRKELYLYEILILTDHKFEIELLVPDPTTIIGPPSIRTYVAHPL